MIVAASPASVPYENRFAKAVRIGLAIVGLGYLPVGAWALLAPTSFCDTFPGGGRHWVNVDGPFNEHLLRDFGALNLAVAFVVLVAVLRADRLTVRVAAGASPAP